MPARVLDDPDEEERVFDQLEAARLRRQATVVTPATAANLSANQAAYPHLPGGANLSLAKAGHGPASPVTRQAAQAAAKRKVKKGLGWHSIGDVVSAVGRGTGSAIAEVGQVGSAVVRPVVRGAFTALEAGAETVDALARDAARTIEEEGVVKGLLFGGSPTRVAKEQPTTAALAVDKAAKGQRVDLGAGYFPAGKTKGEQEAKARATYAVDGHVGTVGRIIANTVTEPGTRPYTLLSGLVDASVDIGADPASVALGATSKARKAAKLFVPDDVRQGAGLVDGARRTVLPEVAEQWLAGDGAKVVDRLAETTDWASARRVFPDLPVKTLVRLVDAETPEAVRAVLKPELGIAIRTKPALPTAATLAVRKRKEGVRLLQTMPGAHIDLDDIDDAVSEVENFARNAKLSPEAEARYAERMARSTGRTGAYRVVTDLLEEVANDALRPHLPEGAKGAERARGLTRIFDNYHEELARYFVDEIGENAAVPGAVIDGAGKALPTPHLFVEYVNHTLPLPDAREIRRVTSTYSRLFTNPAVELTGAALDTFQQAIWKPLVLLRGAWTVRVVGEEQVRMGASGLDSLVNHPLSAIAWATGRRGASGIGGEGFKNASAAADDLDKFAAAMSRGSAGFRDPSNVIRTRNKVLYRRGHTRYARSWGDEIQQLRSDPVAQRVAGGWSKGDAVPGGLTGNHVADAKRWFFEGPGQKFRDQMAEAAGRESLLTREGADAYIDTVFRRIAVKTGQDRRLTEAVATGLMDGAPIREGTGLAKGFVDRLEALAAEGIGPEKVKGDLIVTATGRGSKLAGKADRATEAMFNALMSKPTNYLSRSPAWAQLYWQRAGELLPFMDPAAQRATLKAAVDANLSRAQRSGLRQAARKGAGDLSAEEADLVAKGFATDGTKALLYDLSRRSQWTDASRLIFPFASAWAEILRSWTRIGMQNPQAIRRAQQTVEGARGSGFFRIDPTTNEEVFVYPGTEFLTEHLLGVPAPMTGRVAGLNLFSGSVLPGFGPIVQLPAGALLPDKPEWDEVRKLVLPFGEIETEGGLVETFLPAWFRKFRQAGLTPLGRDDERQWNNTVMDVARYLVSTGKYNMGSAEAVEDTLDAARSKARVLFALRGAAQFFAPSAPTPSFVAHDKDGRAVTAQTLVGAFAKLQEEDYDSAVGKFLDTYGEGALLYMQGKTKGVFPATAEAGEWAREHPGLAKRFPSTHGYFAPPGEGFDIDAYTRQIASGERKPLTPEEAAAAANHRVAAFAYRAAKAKVEGRSDPEAKAWLRSIRDALVEEYPGYEPMPRDLGKRDRVVRELYQATDDPTLAGTDAGQGLNLYLSARDKAQAAAEELGLAGFGRAKKARHLREWLRRVGEATAAEHPGFAPMWEQALEPEMVDDTTEEAA